MACFRSFIRAPVLLAFLSLPAGATDRAAAIATVTGFLTDTEAAISLPQNDRIARLQAIYRSSFDIQTLASRTAPVAVWKAATERQKEHFTAILVCRLATRLARRAGLEGGGTWAIVGTRPTKTGQTVAIRVTQPTDGHRTLLFDVAGTGAVARIHEVRSEVGRLSSRLAAEILRQAGDPGPAPNVDAWMTRVAVSSGRAASFCGLSHI